jgi:hypothetical protein
MKMAIAAGMCPVRTTMKKKKHEALRHDTLGAQLAGVPEDDIALWMLRVFVEAHAWRLLRRMLASVALRTSMPPS